MHSIVGYIRCLETYAERSGARLERSSLPDAVYGRVCRDVITLRSGLAPEQELLTLVHELAHWLAHRDGPSGAGCTIFEYEAEAVEALVMARIGLRCADPADCSPTDDLLSASVSRVVWATGRICDALGVGPEPSALHP